jgi:O-antigen/teichoic acid export membrane protein
MSAAPADRLKAAAGILVGLARRAAGKRILRDGLWIGAGHATTVLAGIISIRIFTELAPASVFGGANLMLGMLSLGMSAALAPLAQTQIRYFMTHEQSGNGANYTRLIARYACLAAVILATISSAALLLWPMLRAGASLWIIAFVALWAVATAARAVLIGPVQAERRMQRYAAWISTEAVLLLTCTALALSLHPSIEAFIGGQAAAIALTVLMFGRLPRQVRHDAQILNMTAEARAQIVRYGLPFLPFAILGFIYGQTDRFILAATLDTAAVGTYVAAFAIASRIPSVTGGIMTDIFRPILFEAETVGDFARGQKIFRVWVGVMAGVSLTVAAGVYVFGNILAQLLLAEPYRSGAREIMALVALGFGFNSIAQVLENRLLSFGASSVLIWTKLAGGIANVACALVFIPLLGGLGASLANALGHAGLLVAAAVALLLTPRDTKTRPTSKLPEETVP